MRSVGDGCRFSVWLTRLIIEDDVAMLEKAISRKTFLVFHCVELFLYAAGAFNFTQSLHNLSNQFIILQFLIYSYVADSSPPI